MEIDGQILQLNAEMRRDGPQGFDIQPLGQANPGNSGGFSRFSDAPPDLMPDGMQQSFAPAFAGAAAQPNFGGVPGQPVDGRVEAVAGQVFIGNLKRWNTDRGFGHIECKETNDIFGKDMFVLKSSFVGVLMNPADLVGTKLRFAVFSGRNGPEARSICLDSDGPMVPLAPGVRADIGIPLMPGLSMPGLGASERWYVGIVKNYSGEKGWGHIGCDETQREYGRDVFVSKNTVPGQAVLFPGDQVRFTVRAQDKGPATEKVEVISGRAAAVSSPVAPGFAGFGTAAAPEVQQIGFSGGPQIGFSGAPDDISAMGATGVPNQILPSGVQSFSTNSGFNGGAPPQGDEGRNRYLGLVKTFDDVRGWGHVECEASRAVYGKDIFLLRSACNGLPVTANNQVEFSVIMSAKGPQARDVCLVDFGPQLATMQREVRSWPY